MAINTSFNLGGAIRDAAQPVFKKAAQGISQGVTGFVNDTQNKFIQGLGTTQTAQALTGMMPQSNTGMNNTIAGLQNQQKTMSTAQPKATTVAPAPAKTTAVGGGMTPEQQANATKNAQLMQQYGQGNYTIDANGNVLPKATQTATNTNQQTQNSQNTQQTPKAPQPGSTFSGIVNNLSNPLNSPYNQLGAASIAGLLGTATGNTKAYGNYQDAVDDLAKLKSGLAQKYGAIDDLPISADSMQGREQALARVASGQLEAAQGRVGQAQTAIGLEQQGFGQAGGLANTGQSNYQGALGTAGTLTSPVGQFGMLTDPTTGQPLNTGVMNNALSNAYNAIRSGASIDDAINYSGLSQFGVLGSNALMNALNGGGAGFNPTAYNTQVSTSQGLASDYQQQAANMQFIKDNIDRMTPLAVNFLRSSGINPTDARVYNMNVGEYLSQFQPGRMAQWGEISSQIQSLALQLNAINGATGTPTGNEQRIAAQDPSLLNANQLESLLNTWKDTGAIRLKSLQENIGRNYSQPGYSGAPVGGVPTSTNLAPGGTAPGGGLTNPAQQVAAGVGLDFGSALYESLKGLSGVILGALGGKLSK